MVSVLGPRQVGKTTLARQIATEQPSHFFDLKGVDAQARLAEPKVALERDMPQLGITIPAAALRRFWLMLTHCHAQVWKGSELARSLGASEPTMRKYLRCSCRVLTDILASRRLDAPRDATEDRKIAELLAYRAQQSRRQQTVVSLAAIKNNLVRERL